VKVPDRVPTLYTQIGNLFGWNCVTLAAALLLTGRRCADRGNVIATDTARQMEYQEGQPKDRS